MSLVTYCGGYCGGCWIKNGKIREMAGTLQKTLRGWAVPERAKALASLEPAAAHYGELEGVLDWIQAQTCQGCRAPGSVCLWGDPVCPVRDCARGKGVLGCFECAEEKGCEKIAILDRGDPTMPGNRARMREIGMATWEAEQVARAGGETASQSALAA
jgi:hypothetical protein